jgi:hypothetical protein
MGVSSSQVRREESDMKPMTARERVEQREPKICLGLQCPDLMGDGTCDNKLDPYLCAEFEHLEQRRFEEECDGN